jgi:hypothetical protein
MARTTDRLSLALLKTRITRALAGLRAACEALNFEAAERAEQEMNEGLDVLARRLRGA